MNDFKGMNIDILNLLAKASPDTLKQFGIGWVKTEFSHNRQHNDPNFVGLSQEEVNRFVYDLAMYHNNGIKVLLIVDYMINHYLGRHHDMNWEDFKQKYIADICKVVDTLSPYVDAWQLWNKQDHYNPGIGYDALVSPADYADMVVAASQIIRQKSCGPSD